MNFRNTVLLFLPLLGTVVAAPAAEKQLRLRIETGPVRHSRGTVRLLLFRSKAGWPHDWNRAWKRLNLAARKGSAVFIIPAMPAGRWAVSVYHDENNDGRLNRNLFGAPSEGYGLSRDAVRRFGPPRFKDAVLYLHGKTVSVQIPLHY